ncbi:MAG: ATPase [Methanobrevibacter sp.]|nr:ATPase [Methanobrevibacter sp.]
MDNFLSNFVLDNEEVTRSDSKKDILKFLKQIGVETRFVSFYDNGHAKKLYIENLRFSRFSRKRTTIFNREYPDIEVVRSSLFQKICQRASKTLASSLNPKDTVLIPKLDNEYNELLYIVLEPYSRKYGIDFVEYNEGIDLNQFDAFVSPLNLNQEVNLILTDIFNGNGINWNKKFEDTSSYYGMDLSDRPIVFPFINVPKEWINDFIGISEEYSIDYETDDIASSFMGFLTEINPQFKENVLAASSFLEHNQK